MTNDATITVNYGSDLRLLVTWPDSDGNPQDITGATVDVFDVDSRLDGVITSSITDAPNGIITVSVPFQPEFRLGRNMFFRVLLIIDGVRTSTTRYYLEIK